MDRLKMAEMMLTLYALYPAIGHMCAAHDRTLVVYAFSDGIIDDCEYICLMDYAGE